jgi:hypothetical protein
MTTTKQTYKRINTFVRKATELLKKGDGENKLEKNTKLAHALRRVLPKCRDVITTSYPEQLEDIDWKYASEDSEKNIARDNIDFKFTREKALQRNAERRKLFNETPVEVPQYFATDIPDWLSDEVKEAFEGFVIEPIADESV